MKTNKVINKQLSEKIPGYINHDLAVEIIARDLKLDKDKVDRTIRFFLGPKVLGKFIVEGWPVLIRNFIEIKKTRKKQARELPLYNQKKKEIRKYWNQKNQFRKDKKRERQAQRDAVKKFEEEAKKNLP